MKNTISLVLLTALSTTSCAHQLHKEAPIAKPASFQAFPIIDDDWLIVITAKKNHVRGATTKPDLWQRIRTKLTFISTNHPRIKTHIDWLAHNPVHLDIISKRAQPFLHYIIEEIDNRGLPIELALVPMVESGFQASATSHQQAAGLWQIIPSTAEHLGLTLNSWYDGRRDIHASTHAALNYLEYLYDFFDGDWLLALAAYNAGEGTVLRAIRANQRAGKATDYWNLTLPRETLAYVPKILALCQVIADPKSYGINLHIIDDKPYLSTVELSSNMELSKAAAMAGIPTDEIYVFNPGIKQGITALQEPYRLLLPKENALILQEKLQGLSQPSTPASHHLQAINYPIQPGD